MKINPYLMFKGNCEEAFKLYADVFGGQILAMLPHKGSPAEAQTPAEWQNKIMHAALKLGDETLMASDSPPANACYVLAAMLERKRVLKQMKTESRDGGRRVLIYEQGSTGDVFIVPDPQLRLDELENVQNEVAELLRGAAQNG